MSRQAAAARLSLLAACVWLTLAPAHAARPNVLFLSVDDMNDWVGALGYAPARTPNIDRLAARGALFANAHAPSPKCNPSRTAILSGLRPSTSGIYGNGEWWKPNLPKVVMLPRYFKDNGYYAAGGGKVFHHTPGFNPPDSWDEYFDLQDDLKSAGFLVPYRRPNHLTSFDWGPLDRADMEMGDGATVRWAEEFLARKHERPFFLAVGLFQPHLPFYAPRAQYDAVGPDEAPVPPDKPGDLDDVPPAGRRMAAFRTNDLELILEHGDLDDVVRAYTACIRHADALIGRLLDALDAGAYAQNTIVVFWSDHGYHFGEKHHFAKNTLWERSSRVPLAIVAPGVTRPQTVSTRPVSLLNLYPTLLDLCGPAAPGGSRGRQPAAVARGPQAGMGASGRDDLRARKPCRSLGALPLYPLRRRRRGTVRPRARPRRMDESRRRPRVCRGHRAARTAAARRQRAGGAAQKRLRVRLPKLFLAAQAQGRQALSGRRRRQGRTARRATGPLPATLPRLSSGAGLNRFDRPERAGSALFFSLSKGNKNTTCCISRKNYSKI